MIYYQELTRSNRALHTPTFHDIELFQRELQLRRERLDHISQFPLRQRCVLVEQGGDELGVDGHQEHQHHEAEGPEVEEEVVAAGLHDVDDHRHDRQADQLVHDERLRLVLGEEAKCLWMERVGR